MSRTQNRPLPTKRMSLKTAWSITLISGVLGTLILWFKLNPLTGILGLSSLAIYSFIYTPMKQKTPWAVFIGAFPGAAPPLIGWTAFEASDKIAISPAALSVFCIQFMWQFPHFWSIAWLSHDDYLRAGYKMMPFNAGRSERSAQLILLYTLFCIPASMLPWALNQPMVGNVAFAVAVASGVGFSFCAYRLRTRLSMDAAKHLMYASFLYLPLVQVIYVLDKIPH
mgnify:CR=1 FL=1